MGQSCRRKDAAQCAQMRLAVVGSNNITIDIRGFLRMKVLYCKLQHIVARGTRHHSVDVGVGRGRHTRLQVLRLAVRTLCARLSVNNDPANQEPVRPQYQVVRASAPQPHNPYLARTLFRSCRRTEYVSVVPSATKLYENTFLVWPSL